MTFGFAAKGALGATVVHLGQRALNKNKMVKPRVLWQRRNRRKYIKKTQKS